MEDLRQYNILVSDYFIREDVPTGEVGIEIEVEGTNLPTNIPSYWEYHADGSLRGESAEYVLLKPIKRENVVPYLEYLAGKLKSSTVHDSPRTSVHVHVNMSQRTILQVYVILTVYFILENLLVELAGKNRVGNLFCLRVKDAEFLLSTLVKSAQRDSYSAFSSEQSLRYSAANICALPKFNSLEFRALRGTTDPAVISEWINILLYIVDQSVSNYKTPLEVIQDFSAVGAEQFALKILGTHLEKFNGRNIHRILWEGLRTVQELAYCTDWMHTDYIPVKKLFTKKEAPWRNPLAPRVRVQAAPAFPTARSFVIPDTPPGVVRITNEAPTPQPPPTPLNVNWTDFVVTSEAQERDRQILIEEEQRILAEVHQREHNRILRELQQPPRRRVENS